MRRYFYSYVLSLVNPQRSLLMKVKRFQSHMYQHMFPDSVKPSPIILSPLRNHHDNTKAKCAILFTNILFEYGLIDSDDTTGSFSIMQKYRRSKIFHYSDELTTNNVVHFSECMSGRGCHPNMLLLLTTYSH